MWNLLFDIDGTLLLTDGAGSAGLKKALFKLFGVTEFPEISFHGRTDYAISRDMLTALGIPFERHYHSVRRAYWQALENELAKRQGKLLPGALSLLSAVHQDGRFNVGLLTGNGERAARLKLMRFDIEHYFRFGGYGDWHADRADVARMSWSAALRWGGEDANTRPPIVVGDTPADVACARAIGAKVIAVATGPASLADLSAAHPDWLFNDLTEVSVDFLASQFEK